MSKKQALTEFHRGSILAAAERLFAEKGIEGTTMDDIAREAEYSKATLYVYFQSKEEIINAILLSSMILLQKKIREAIERSTGWQDGYNAVCGAIIRFYGENPTAYDAASGDLELLSDSGESKSIKDILRVSDETDAILAEFLDRGVREGLVRVGLPTTEVVQLFWAALSGMVRMAERRASYMEKTIGVNRETFLHHGAQLLLDAITTGKSGGN